MSRVPVELFSLLPLSYGIDPLFMTLKCSESVLALQTRCYAPTIFRGLEVFSGTIDTLALSSYKILVDLHSPCSPKCW